MPRPTRFPELNRVLEQLVEGMRGCLGNDLLGVYLQGSFALGTADEHSDVDFLALTAGEPNISQEECLGAMHRAVHAGASSWAQHLEGSYAPHKVFRRVDPHGQSFLFLDNGASELEHDAHCNTAVARWILRTSGITLFGPAPESLIDPVEDDDLRAEARAALREYVAWAPEPTKAGPMSRWKQPYLVLTICRILSTIEFATVASKAASAHWACQRLPPRWRPLIAQAVADRSEPWQRVYQPAEEGAIRETLAFANYALERSESL